MSDVIELPSDGETVSEKDEAQFHIEEFKSLRTEIGRWWQEIRFLERAGVIGPVLLYSWLFANYAVSGKDHALLALWGAPVILAAFLWIRVAMLKSFNRVIAGYIKSIEIVHRHPKVVGWEHFLDDYREKRANTWLGLVGTENGFWALLMLMYGTILIWRIFYAH